MTRLATQLLRTSRARQCPFQPTAGGHAERETASRRRFHPVEYPHLALVACALGAWAWSLHWIDLRAAADTGLISVLPLLTLAAFFSLNVGFCVALGTGPQSHRLAAGYVVVLIVMLYGITSVVGEAARGGVVWRHAGVIDNLARTGRADSSIDAYFNWPGLFMLGATLSRLGDFSPMAFASWAPVIFNVLYVGPLVMIFRTVTSDTRLQWLGVWLFFLGNWVNQDYFSPQATAFFLYLVVIAVLLRWFVVEDERPRAGLLATVIVLFAATVPTHQLTPFVMLSGVGALVVLRLCTARTLPLIMAVLLAAWMAFAAATYMNGHLEVLTQEVGSLAGSAAKNVGERVRGSPGHMVVVRARLVMGAALWATAALGAVRRRALGRDALTIAVLAGMPFPFLILQPYGGEMLLRAYLFSLPFAALFAAAALLGPSRGVLTGRRVAGLILAGTVSITGFLLIRYGNERMDQFSRDEVDVVRHAYEIAPPGSLLVAGVENLPWKYRDYERYDYMSLTKAWGGKVPVEGLVEGTVRTLGARTDSFVILTRAQKAYVALFGLLPSGTLDDLERGLMESPAFHRVYANRDGSVFAFDPPQDVS